jgi:pyridoxine 5-phosphate synthase
MYILKEITKTHLTIETAPTDEMIDKVMEVKPSSVMLVSDHADADSPVSGIDFGVAPIDFADIADRLKGGKMSVCFFIEPDNDAVKGAAKSGADSVMINCTGYTGARNVAEAQEELDRIDGAAQSARRSNLSILAGRGIDYKNVRPLLELGLINEYVIGQAIAARAMLTGYQSAVSEMVRLLGQSAAQ